MRIHIGVVDVAVPEQIADNVISEIDGRGSTVTSTSKVDPIQLPEVGVTVYEKVIGAFVELTNVPDVNDVAVLALDIPLTPFTVGALHA